MIRYELTHFSGQVEVSVSSESSIFSMLVDVCVSS